MSDEYDIENYESDVFAEIEDDYPVKRHRVCRPRTTTVKPKHTKKDFKISQEVQEMQERYNALVIRDNVTKKEWQDFFLSIEKFVMKQAYKANFNRFVDKTSDLWGYLSHIILESIIPKVNPDGTKSCWYKDPVKGKIKRGYDSAQTNLGNYLSNKTRWTVIEFNQGDYAFTSICTDTDLEPIPDTDDKIEQLIEEQVIPDFPYTISVHGQPDEYMEELKTICLLRTF